MDFFHKIQLLLDRIAVKIYVIQQARNHLLKIMERKYLFFFIRQTLIFFNTEEVAPGSFGHRPFLLKPKPLLISIALIPWE